MLDERHAALERATAGRARKQAEMEAFAYTITHDVKPRMSSIGVTAEGMRDPRRDPADVRTERSASSGSRRKRRI